MSFEALQQQQLTAVEFVEDFLQLRFGDALLTLYAWPHVADRDGISIAFTEPGYRDALCSVISEDVEIAEWNEGSSLTVEFANGTVLALSLREEDLDGPEAGSFTAADGERIEF